MFELDQSGSYSWPVPVDVATSGGKHHRQSFDAEFARLPQDRIDQIQIEASKLRRLAEYGSDETPDQLAKVKAIVDEVLVGWSGITEKGEQVPYSEMAKVKLLNKAGVAAAILGAFADSLSNGKSKN